MKTLTGLFLATAVVPWSLSAGAAGLRSSVPAPRLRANELAPLCRVCDKGRACGDNCALKKLASSGTAATPKFAAWQI